jgi:hypothetical protein
MKARIVHVLLLLVVAAGCKKTGNDADYIPYELTGMQVMFCADNHQADTCKMLGAVKGGYEERKKLMEECGKMARNEARSKNIDSGWGYVCCTMTDNTDCATKVR